MPAIFNPVAKKINKALSVRVIVTWSDHKLLWLDSYKGIGYASTLPESILHKIVIIINHIHCPLVIGSNTAIEKFFRT